MYIREYNLKIVKKPVYNKQYLIQSSVTYYSNSHFDSAVSVILARETVINTTNMYKRTLMHVTCKQMRYV